MATGERPVLRRLLAAGGLAALAGLVWLWWPNGEYRPYQPGERARLQETVRAGSELRSGRPALTEADAARLGGAPFRSSGSPTTTAPPVSEPQLEPGSVPPGEPTPSTSTTQTQSPTPSTATTLRPATTTTTISGTSSTTTSTTPQASTTTTNPTTTESTQP